jgi:hypothetical protein
MILHGSALVIVVAIDQVVAFARRVEVLTRDPELVEARRRFDAVVPDVEPLRDLIAHHESYAVGEGHRQTGRRTPPISDRTSDVHLLDRGRYRLHPRQRPAEPAEGGQRA